MHLYDIFGVDLVDDEFCGNTILCAYFTPQYQFGNCDGEIIKKRSEIMGAYVALFGATSEYAVNTNLQFRYKDYGGFVKSPVCNEFSDKFVLFSLLCQTQFVINCVEKYVAEECTTKFRFLYLQYYYLSKILPEINQKLHANFAIDGTLVSSPFRNAMAHYKIGVALRNDEIVNSDPFFGLTQKFLQCDYYSAKQFVLNNLSSLVYQIKKYLQIDKG